MTEKKIEESVHYFVRGLFRGIAETEKIAEQREELEAHINDRIADSMAQGISYEKAFSDVVASLGNLDELIDTITGTRKKIYVKKASLFMLTGGVIYGTIYMIATGIWFYFHSFGFSAVYIAIPGWLGYAIPALIAYIDYKRHPYTTAYVSLDFSEKIHASIAGWLIISIVCWIVNILFITTTSLLTVIWAWIPTAGIFTWPLMEAGYAWMVNHLKSLEPEGD